MRTTRLSAVAVACAAWVICVVAGTTRARAQTDDLPLSLQDAVARALDGSHRLGELAARARAAAATTDTARLADKPAVTAIAGYQRTNHVDEFGVPAPDGTLRVIYPDLPNNLQGRIDLQWPLYTAGRSRALTEAADAEARALAGDTAAARADLVLEVTRTYWAAVTGRENVRVLTESLDRIAAHLAETRARLDAGLVPPNEVLSVEAQQASERARLVEARTVYEQTLVLLRQLVGVRGGITLTESLGTPLPVSVDGSEAVRMAHDTRPERRALLERIEAAAARLAATEAERRPRLAVTSGVDYARPNPRRFPREDTWQHSWDVGLSLSWSLFDSGRVASRVAAAAAAKEALDEQLQDVDARLSTEAQQRLLDVQSSGARIEAAEIAVRAAAEAQRVVRERYAAGVATNVDVIDAETALLAVELERTRAVASAHIARAQLARAIGR